MGATQTADKTSWAPRKHRSYFNLFQFECVFFFLYGDNQNPSFFWVPSFQWIPSGIFQLQNLDIWRKHHRTILKIYFRGFLRGYQQVMMLISWVKNQINNHLGTWLWDRCDFVQWNKCYVISPIIPLCLLENYLKFGWAESSCFSSSIHHIVVDCIRQSLPHLQMNVVPQWGNVVIYNCCHIHSYPTNQRMSIC